MRKRAGFIFVLGTMALLAAVPVHGQSDEAEKPDPIDTEVQHLEDKNPSTAGQIEAISTGLKRWDEELNKAYSKLLKLLPEKERETLKQARLIPFR